MVQVDSNGAPPHFIALPVSEKDALLAKLWAENEALKAQLADLQKKLIVVENMETISME